MHPALARLIGDRAAVLPSKPVAPPDTLLRSFPAAVAVGVHVRNPYKPPKNMEKFPEIKLGWHPLTPPHRGYGHILKLMRRPSTRPSMDPGDIRKREFPR